MARFRSETSRSGQSNRANNPRSAGVPTLSNVLLPRAELSERPSAVRKLLRVRTPALRSFIVAYGIYPIFRISLSARQFC